MIHKLSSEITAKSVEVMNNHEICCIYHLWLHYRSTILIKPNKIAIIGTLFTSSNFYAKPKWHHLSSFMV